MLKYQPSLSVSYLQSDAIVKFYIRGSQTVSYLRSDTIVKLYIPGYCMNNSNVIIFVTTS